MNSGCSGPGLAPFSSTLAPLNSDFAFKHDVKARRRQRFINWADAFAMISQRLTTAADVRQWLQS